EAHWKGGPGPRVVFTEAEDALVGSPDFKPVVPVTSWKVGPIPMRLRHPTQPLGMLLRMASQPVAAEPASQPKEKPHGSLDPWGFLISPGDLTSDPSGGRRRPWRRRSP